jgi:molybdenum cofactor cytidylyltransferase
VISTLVLAAGEGRRIGRTKALVELVGLTLLERVVATCAASMTDEIVVVTGAEAGDVEAHALALRADVPAEIALRVVRNERWAEGRTGSLQAGWSSCREDASIVVFPVDHALVRVVTLDALLGVQGYAASAPDALVPVTLTGESRRRGHPIVLSSRLRAEALALGLDEPLRDLVHRHDVLEVPVDDDGILLDIDTPDDLARAEELLAHS